MLESESTFPFVDRSIDPVSLARFPPKDATVNVERSLPPPLSQFLFIPNVLFARTVNTVPMISSPRRTWNASSSRI